MKLTKDDILYTNTLFREENSVWSVVYAVDYEIPLTKKVIELDKLREVVKKLKECCSKSDVNCRVPSVIDDLFGEVM